VHRASPSPGFLPTRIQSGSLRQGKWRDTPRDPGYAGGQNRASHKLRAAINAIAQLKDAVGSLTRVKRIVRLEGTMQVAMGFRDHPKALDGASDLINLVFGEAGRHSRMIYTNPEMPLDSPVLIVLLAEIRD
jgi:hypothetical protein